jgi:hypothetical protein
MSAAVSNSFRMSFPGHLMRFEGKTHIEAHINSPVETIGKMLKTSNARRVKLVRSMC